MNKKSIQYPRGKSWNWHLRAIKRGDPQGLLWMELRKAKSSLVRELGTIIYGKGSGSELTGLEMVK